MYLEQVSTEGKRTFQEVIESIQDEDLKVRYSATLNGLLSVFGKEGISLLTLILTLVTHSSEESFEAVQSIQSDIDCIQYLIDVLDDNQLLMLQRAVLVLNGISKEEITSMFQM